MENIGLENMRIKDIEDIINIALANLDLQGDKNYYNFCLVNKLWYVVVKNSDYKKRRFAIIPHPRIIYAIAYNIFIPIRHYNINWIP